ncbi:MAG: NADH-quinone oxidoreductase subunit N [Actinomycetota bacterium]|nr:NADH-quinone oxidoreductase subunit N [Actinomycetota bacterium]
MAPLPVLLAQGMPPPPVEFSTIAPELLLVTAALLLLLIGVGGSARSLVGLVTGLATAGAGVGLVLRDVTTPGVIVVAFGVAVVALGLGLAARPSLMQTWLAELALVAALGLTVWQWVAIYDPSGPRSALSGAIALDGVSLYTRVTVLVSALLVLPIGHAYLHDRGIYRLEFEPLILLSVIGMTVLGAAGDLLIVVIAIELLSLPLYVLAGLARRDRRSQEAAIKYFLMGAIASAVLLYGIAVLYVATGTIDLSFLAEGVALITAPSGVVLLGIALVTVGLGFKSAAVPFHFWVPDVYQGSPTNVTAFMTAATRAAAFAVLLRVYLLAFGRLDHAWVPVLAVIAAATMMLGAVAAVLQRDLKRLLAYSSIAHVGYGLIGVVSASPAGLSSTLWYSLTYSVSAIGAFGCVIAIERRRRGEVALVDLRGLGRRAPVLTGVLGLCMLSLAGIPATAGFAGKLAVFRAGVAANLSWLVLIGVVSSAIAAFYYLRVLGSMYLEEPDDETDEPILSTGLAAGVAAAAAAVVVLGVQPDAFLTLADAAASIAR